MSLLNQAGPKKAKPKPNWSADKAAQRVLDAREARRTDPVGIANQVAARLLDKRLIAIDPGDVYNGVAIFRAGVCERTFEMNRKQVLELVSKSVDTGQVDCVIVENFTLYPDKAAEQAGSEMLTSQVIGAIRWIVDNHNDMVDSWASAHGGECHLPPVELVLQPASVKEPATVAARHYGYLPVSLKPGGRMHMRDAEIHGIYLIMRGKGQIRGSEDNRG